MLSSSVKLVMRRALSGLVRRGSLTVTMADGRSFECGDGTMPRAAIRFADSRAELAFLLDPELQFGELFMNARLLVEQGTVYDVLELVLRDANLTRPNLVVRTLSRLRFAIRGLMQRNLPQKARANVAHHYDLDARLYDLFLDQDRQYSCAYFEHPDQSLDEAQLAKKRHIVAKLLVEPGMNVLDIGCGYGGLAQYLARVAGAAHVTGITLSKEQIAYATASAQSSGLTPSLEFRLEDYRFTKGQFDRIVSVGMFEHVGIGFYDTFFAKCRDLLAEDGVMLLHFIGNIDVPDSNNPWIEKYIFPGGYLPTLGEVTPSIERSGLVMTDIEIVRLHYARTLRLWRERFMARREEAKALFDERFCKMWEFYLSMAETAFRYQGVVVFQFQLARKQENIPLTRDYVAEREAGLRKNEAAIL